VQRALRDSTQKEDIRRVSTCLAECCRAGRELTLKQTKHTLAFHDRSPACPTHPQSPARHTAAFKCYADRPGVHGTPAHPPTTSSKPQNSLLEHTARGARRLKQCLGHHKLEHHPAHNHAMPSYLLAHGAHMHTGYPLVVVEPTRRKCAAAPALTCIEAPMVPIMPKPVTQSA
jgi:hypothetical protein